MFWLGDNLLVTNRATYPGDNPSNTCGLSFHRFWFSFLTTVGCRHFHTTASLSMVRTRPVHLKPRVPLVNREPRADLDEYLGPAAAPHVDFNSNLIAIEANPDLVPFLLSEVEKNLGFSCQLAATDQMDPAFLGDVYHAGRRMEDYLDKADADYEIQITNMLKQLKDLRGQILEAMAMRASLQAVDWRRTAGVLPQAPPGSYVSSINFGASSSSQVPCTDTSGIPLAMTTNNTNDTGANTDDTSG